MVGRARGGEGAGHLAEGEEGLEEEGVEGGASELGAVHEVHVVVLDGLTEEGGEGLELGVLGDLDLLNVAALDVGAELGGVADLEGVGALRRR